MKQSLRERHRAARRALDPDEIASASAAISQRILALPELAPVSTVAIYHALPREVQTAALGVALGREGKRCVFPRMIHGSKVLAFAPLGHTSELVVAAMGIREPPSGNDIDLAAIDLFVVPGLAFDRGGGRLGQGGGYYDATLAAAPKALRVGVCFSGHLQDEPIPMRDHDQRMDLVVTPKEIARIPGRLA